jgi:hypothetical protein
MTAFNLEIASGKTRFRPGENLEGVVRWEFSSAPESIAVRLSWQTKGKGTENSNQVKTVQFERPLANGQQPFQIPLPADPYSFSGKLISLVWSVEAVAEPAGKSNRINITISPTGDEILLHKT